MAHTAIDLIEIKRDGGVLSSDAIEWLIAAYTDGSVPDYQMSAMAMAILLNGMNNEELAAWTEAMLHSGEVMDFSDIAAAKIDKHSTGGVGDKISIPLVPLVAACGIYVPMISGRGLGHTGGTLDKLESIPGFTTGLDPDSFRRVLVEHGLVLAGASETMIPADRKLYALRNATGTVPSIPLISSSIMSKKLAEGLDGLLLDVKTGSGATIKDLDRSRALAQTMVGIGASHGVNTVAFLTSMEQPLGDEVGNANEIKESIDVLRGEGPDDVTELTMVFGETMLELAGIDGGREQLEEAIESGAALQKLIDVTVAHGGDPSVVEDPTLLVRAPHEAVIDAPHDGYVTRCDALTIGVSATRLGAGRERKDDIVDPGVGITLKAKLGDHVAKGDPLAIVRYGDQSKWDAQRDNLSSAWTISDQPMVPPDLIIEKVDVTTI
ncbi:MAG: thymidine phosphorylase [Acidobacteria bacterium]|nr:MAG: thymidine phosphorylase [Acidobacteriota bacterium]